ncbi:MAG: hypothetical protein KatS3mg087_0524 [Patescibacteria group bacterium]|nr:MAG: hypothetical protein KatS3mg087_0524 [Patescibacteria group bacterium]
MLPDNNSNSNQCGYSDLISPQALERYRNNQGYVYLIHAEGTNRYKIGRSVNPIARLEILKGQSPYPLRIIESFWTPDAIKDEQFLHSKHEKLRAYGEWFELDQQARINICKSFTLDYDPIASFTLQGINICLDKTITKASPSYGMSDVFAENLYTEICRLINRCQNLTRLSLCIDFLLGEFLEEISRYADTYYKYEEMGEAYCSQYAEAIGLIRGFSCLVHRVAG